MSEKENKTNAIPISVLISDAKAKVEEIVNHPLLPPIYLEMIFKDAWIRTGMRAEQQLKSEYESYQETLKENEKKDSKEDEK